MKLSKYQEVAKRILEFKEDDFKLDMKKYKHTCGTTFCLAGWLAHQDDYPDEYFDNQGTYMYGRYSAYLIDYSLISLEWDFLFCPIWSDSLDEAKSRAQFVLDNNRYPKYNTWKEVWNYGTQ